MTFLAVAVYIQMFQISARRWCGRGIKLVWALMLPLMLPFVLSFVLPFVLQYEDKWRLKCESARLHQVRDYILKVRKCGTTSV